MNTPPPRASIMAPDIPLAFDAVIARGMAKDVDARYQSVMELAEAARAALTGAGDAPPAAPPAAPSQSAPMPQPQPIQAKTFNRRLALESSVGRSSRWPRWWPWSSRS